MENHVNNYFIIHRVVYFLNHFLDGYYMADAQQLSPNDLQMVFRKRGEQKAVKFYLGEESFLYFPGKFSSSKKSITVLKQLENRKFLKAAVHPHDRSFRIHFSDDFCLVVLLYGRNSNLLLYQHNTLIYSLITNIKTHSDKPLSYFKDQLPATKSAYIVSVEKTGFKKAVSTYFPAFTKGMLQFLNAEKVAAENPEIQFEQIKEWDRSMLNGSMHIYTAEKMPSQKNAFLSLTHPEFDVFSTNEIDVALNEFARLYFKILQFNIQKKKLVHSLRQKIEKAEGRLKSYYEHLDSLGKTKNYKHQADLIMANLHEIPRGAENIELTDFDGNGKIKIKIKRELSAQEWAEKLYKKAKKQQIEREQTETHIMAAEKMLLTLSDDVQKAENVEDTNELKIIFPQEKAKETIKKQEAVPYKKFEIDGFNILVGKSAADNDKLSFGVAKKDDTWLHAKDVAGSHVIIQNPSRKEIQKTTLEKAAQLAAYYSKGKGSKLFPVAYTLKKFVRKPKGAGPGKVVVDKETVLIVEPKLPD